MCCGVENGVCKYISKYIRVSSLARGFLGGAGVLPSFGGIPFLLLFLFFIPIFIFRDWRTLLQDRINIHRALVSLNTRIHISSIHEYSL